MTYALHPDEIPAQLAVCEPVSVGRTFPAAGVALIVAVDLVVVWLLRLVL